MQKLADLCCRMTCAIGIANTLACAPIRSDEVQITGDAQRAMLVLETIRAAEIHDRAGFLQRTGRSAEPAFAPPAMAAVDRSDEGCVLRSIDASIPMVNVLWACPDATKQNIQRSFLVEHGRVTHIWNDWGDPAVFL